MTRPFEGFTTDVALMWLNFQVCEQMCREITDLIKVFVTDLALERLFARVDECVSCEKTVPNKGLATDIAFITLLLSAHFVNM